MPKTPEQLARKRARKAEKARRRRALNGATPRTESKAAQLRDLGVSPDAFYARRRRNRLREDESEDRGLRDGVTYPSDGVSYPLDIEPAPPIDASHGDGAADPAPAGPDIGAVRLYSDLWGGWVPVPLIRTSAEPPIDASPGRADRLIAAVAGLPGGRDPDHHKVLRRLVDAAEARERRTLIPDPIEHDQIDNLIPWPGKTPAAIATTYED